jgi:hypothetical protein
MLFQVYKWQPTQAEARKLPSKYYSTTRWNLRTDDIVSIKCNVCGLSVAVLPDLKVEIKKPDPIMPERVQYGIWKGKPLYVNKGVKFPPEPDMMTLLDLFYQIDEIATRAVYKELYG